MNQYDRDPRLSAARKAADVARLRALAVTPELAHRGGTSWRTRTVIVGTTSVLVAGAGVATAAVVLAPEHPTVTITGRCYSEPSKDTSDKFPGTTAASATGRDGWTPDLVSNLVDDCAAVWRAGAFKTTAGAQADANGDYPVPQLTACVLPAGEAAVFPNTDCAELGFAPLATAS